MGKLPFAAWRNPAHRLECAVIVVQVWVHAEMDSAGRIKFAADSDSKLTRGLAAVLVKALSGLTPDQVLQVCYLSFYHAQSLNWSPKRSLL